MAKVPHNKGDAYEAKISDLLKATGMLPPNVVRAGGGAGPDIQFVHRTRVYNLEVKKDLKADYGQKYFRWERVRGWFWALPDPTTDLYDHLGVLEYLNKKNLTPIKHRLPDKSISLVEKKQDQHMFEDRSFVTSASLVSSYYQNKKVYYIQIGDGFGFYSLASDPAGLGVPMFDATLCVRFRAKTIKSAPIHKYGFIAVLKVITARRAAPKQSSFNIEATDSQPFPTIEP